MTDKISSLYKRVKSSKDGKTVIANFGYLSLLQIAGYAFPLITMPYLARVIGTEGFGKIAFASAIIAWCQTISDWGFTFTATRDIAQHRDDKETVSHMFSNVLWARLLLTLISGIVLGILVATIPYFRENAAIIFVTFLLVPGHVLFPDWFFQAVEKMKYTTIFNLLLKLIFTISVFFAIKEKDDYIWQPLLTTFGYITCGIGALFLILKKWGYKLYRPNINDVMASLKGSTDVFLNNLMPNLYNSFSVMLLGFFGGSATNGIYDGGNKFPTIFYNLQSGLSRAFFPFLSRRTEKHKLYGKLNIGIALVGSILMIALAPFVVHIMLGEEFEGSIIIMQILALSLISLAISNTYGTNYLIIHHQEKPLRKATSIASVIGMTIAIPLVYYFKAMGAASVILFCRTLLATSSYALARKHMKRQAN